MSQNFETAAAVSLIEQQPSLSQDLAPGECEGCIGCNAPDITFEYDDYDDSIVTHVGELPSEWVDHLRRECGFDDDEIIEHAQTWYSYGYWPTRCLELNGAAIWNGQLLKQHFVCSFDGTEYPAVEVFPDHFDGDGNTDAERVAECMNWCRANCRGNWLLTTREHVRQLWEVFVSFDDPADQVAYLRDHP